MFNPYYVKNDTLSVQMGYFESGHCFIYLKCLKKSIKIHEYTFKFVE